MTQSNFAPARPADVAAQDVRTRPANDFGAFVARQPCMRDATGRGPLNGLTFAVKDFIDVAGCRTGGGNPDWLAGHPAAAHSAPVVEALLGAGARLVGKTNMDELAFSLEGANAHYGTPVNPACPDRLPGGSSSGSAVAVAAGLVDFALGTDTGGSVRVPASFTGVFGFRPNSCTGLDGRRRAFRAELRHDRLARPRSGLSIPCRPHLVAGSRRRYADNSAAAGQRRLRTRRSRRRSAVAGAGARMGRHRRGHGLQWRRG